MERVGVEAWFLLRDDASKGMAGVRREAEAMISPLRSAQSAVGSLGAALGVSAGAAGAVAFTKDIVQARSELEQTQLSMGSLIYQAHQMGKSVGISDFNEALQAGADTFAVLERHAAKAIGETRDYVDAWKMLEIPVLNAGGNLSDVLEISKLLVPTAHTLKQDMPIAMQSVRQALLGMVDARDQLINMLGFTTAEINQMAKEGRALGAIKEALARNEEAAGEFGKTLEANIATSRDEWNRFKRDLGTPLFEVLKADLLEVNNSIADNRKQVRGVAADLGEDLAGAYRDLRDSVLWMRENWDWISDTMKTVAEVWIASKLVSGMRVVLGLGTAWRDAMIAGALAQGAGAGAGAAGAIGTSAGAVAGMAGTLAYGAATAGVGLVAYGATYAAVDQWTEAYRLHRENAETTKTIAEMDAERLARIQATGGFLGRVIPWASDPNALAEMTDARREIEGGVERALMQQRRWVESFASQSSDLAEFLQETVPGLQGVREAAFADAAATAKRAALAERKPPVVNVNRVEIKVDARTQDPDRVGMSVLNALSDLAAHPRTARTAA